jgi:hypothetical protein
MRAAEKWVNLITVIVSTNYSRQGPKIEVASDPDILDSSSDEYMDIASLTQK